jgi:phenylpyruvate tautomerase PptA (4-oxalocrotonate tautomerase family)
MKIASNECSYFVTELTMPNILIKVPYRAFDATQKNILARKVNEVAASVEQMPSEPTKRFVNWIVIDEVEQGMFTCGGFDASSQALPCIAMVYLPAGVLDGASRSVYVAAMHEAFVKSLADGDSRQIASSVILHEIADGQWGGNGKVWRLPDFAKAAGYAHLKGIF